LEYFTFIQDHSFEYIDAHKYESDERNYDVTGNLLQKDEIGADEAVWEELQQMMDEFFKIKK